MTLPVLLIGGSGCVGSRAAAHLRRFHPDLPLVIGGRDQDRAQATADKLGTATAARIDLARPDLGLDPEQRFGAVALFPRDAGFNAQRFAQDRRIPFHAVTGSLVETAQDLTAYVHGPQASPVVLASHWMAGVPVILAAHHAGEFTAVNEVSLAFVFDPQEEMGPAAGFESQEAVQAANPLPLIRKNGSWVWAQEEADRVRTITTADTARHQADGYGSLDVLSLAEATGAASARADLLVTESAGTRAGRGPSHEIVIEITGTLHNGVAATRRFDLSHPAGQSSLTALGAAVAIEHLLGLTGTPAPTTGLHFPETVIDPAHLQKRLDESGTHLT
ncbi:saccharopine dehydrogenase [Streptomyces sp. NBC_01433]|uniref:saccharopine dehydrogenase n=1 Tax=Streptomyces sp. NBC_01433 TaxID=2903864 RepID=UPI0022563738|nr:saccharopine dehydrogenase [Streptomyces sp. NBC_01433]MCX4681201.1 saccharopine dehydrogenase [Streptomyces sp. NBC_01433]